MTDTYPYAEKRTNARRWLKEQGVIAYLGDRWLLAKPQPRKQPMKRLPRLTDARAADFHNEVPALCRRQAG